MSRPRNGGKGADADARPEARPVVAGGVPAELRSLPRWVLWRYEWNAHKGKWDKPPLSPRTGHKTSWLRPGGWAGFDAAVAACRAGKGGAKGVGLVLSTGPDDPLDLAVIDLDVPGLEDPLRTLGTYVEHSPTAGKGGCHAWVRGGLPPGVKSLSGRVEVYAERRFVCVTGDPLPWSSRGVATPAPDALAAALRALGVLGRDPGPPEPPPVGAREAVEALPCGEDDRLLAAAMGASNGAAFRRLWEGDVGEYRGDDGRPDASRADLALCNLLAFYWQKDPVAVDRMFRRSGLFRPEKWDARHYQTGETYGEHTVGMAVRDCRATYTGTRRTANGEAVRPQASTASPASTGGGPAGAGAGGRLPGRLASSVRTRPVEWFLHPWFPRRMLTLLAGDPETGKSTFLAMLAARARRTVYLPGPEEYVEGFTVPRLEAAGVDLDRVRILDDRRYSLFDDRALLTRVLTRDGADLLVIDPVDSSVPDGFSDIASDQVRQVLEALETVARDTGAAVVGVRHPGKAAGNVARGSQAWRAVPRSIVELRKDDGPPLRRIVVAYKWSFPGARPAAREFEITGPDPGRPGGVVFGGEASEALTELLAALPDQLERLQVEYAADFIKRMLKDGEQEVPWMLALGRTHGYSESTMQRAKRLLGVKTRHEGHGRESKHFWVPPPAEGADEEGVQGGNPC